MPFSDAVEVTHAVIDPANRLQDSAVRLSESPTSDARFTTHVTSLANSKIDGFVTTQICNSTVMTGVQKQLDH